MTKDFDYKQLQMMTWAQTAIIGILWAISMILAGFLGNAVYEQLKSLNLNMVQAQIKIAEHEKDIGAARADLVRHEGLLNTISRKQKVLEANTN